MELLECSICGPRIGVEQGPPVICASFCDRVFKACAEAYYLRDAITQASEWIRNDTELCHAEVFSVKEYTSEGMEETLFYGV
ncbi:putative folate receptor [Rosa chinensis]|uniref:Putative folate receptor n=1 Tax=Rosa chinensis TaxID=74649 RepID=A0A2P6RT00_ROSCH|nr:putative folate receptor [Rosa chinensis]